MKLNAALNFAASYNLNTLNEAIDNIALHKEDLFSNQDRFCLEIAELQTEAKGVADYCRCEMDEISLNMARFYHKCLASGLSIEDADRYAMLNTLLGYDIGLCNARSLILSFWENDFPDIMELDATDDSKLYMLKAISHSRSCCGVISFLGWGANDGTELKYFADSDKENGKVFYVDTPIGKLKVSTVTPEEYPYTRPYPGVYIDLVREDEEDELLAVVEWNSRKQYLQTCVYQPENREAPDSITVHHFSLTGERQ